MTIASGVRNNSTLNAFFSGKKHLVELTSIEKETQRFIWETLAEVEP